MSEVACNNCKGACCKGKPILIMRLTDDELTFMKARGNEFMTVAEPVDHDRDEVIYPAGIQINQERGTFNWLAERGREYEPLAANYGRYALVGDCQYLAYSPLLGFEYCTAYEDRPLVCREFVVGSTACLAMRSQQNVPLPMPTVRRPE